MEQDERKIYDELTPQLQFLVVEADRQLKISGMFSDVGVAAAGNKIVFYAAPRWIFEDMVEGLEESLKERFSYTLEIDKIGSVFTTKDILEKVTTIMVNFMTAYLKGNRKVYKDNGAETKIITL